MKVRGVLLLFGWFVVAQACVVTGQDSPSTEQPKAWIELVDLSPPYYPPIARQARIMGDVKLRLGIRRDGSLASAEVVSGPPMLREAALTSARKSKFLCQNCHEEITPYVFTYTFGFRTDGHCGDVRLRAAKCLYLWRCGIHTELPARSPVIGDLLDGVVILADTACVETTSSTTSR